MTQSFLLKNLLCIFLSSFVAFSLMLANCLKAENFQTTHTNATSQKLPQIEPFSHTIGSFETAHIQMRIFSSLSCPSCAYLHQKLIPQLEKKYAGKILFLIHDYPSDGPSLKASTFLASLNVPHHIKAHIYALLLERQQDWLPYQDTIQAILKILGEKELYKQTATAVFQDNKAMLEIIKARSIFRERFMIHQTPTLLLGYTKGKAQEQPLDPNLPLTFDALSKQIHVFLGTNPPS